MTDIVASELTFSDSVVVARDAGDLYDMVSDVTRMGEWSPVCRSCSWKDADGPRVGAWFTGRNEDAGATWETPSEVTAADRGREFTFVVAGSFVRWSYTFEPAGEGTRVTESWEVLPDCVAYYDKEYGADAKTRMQQRADAARSGIPATLAALKKAAEAGG